MARTPRDKVQEEEPLEQEREQDAQAEACGSGCGSCGGDCAAAPDADGDAATAEEDAASAERERYLRLAAEYDNFRKRSAKEREALYAQVRSDTIAKLLPVYDNLARALKQECADEAFYKGVEMTMTGLCEILSGMGVEEIASVGEKFDPERHRALAHFEDPELGEGAVTEEFEKGFMFCGKVIRFAAVAVAN